MTGSSRYAARAAAVAVTAVLALGSGVAAWSAPPPPGPTDPTSPASPTPSGSPAPTPTPTPTSKPTKKPDKKAPPPPNVGTPVPGEGGQITVTIGAEKNADVVVREDGSVVAQGRADGGTVTLTWTTTTGTHTYAARATDKAGNTSTPSSFSAEADADPPPLNRVQWTVGTKEDTRSSVRFRTAVDSDYRVLVDGSVVAEGTADEAVVQRRLDIADGGHQVAVEAVDDVGNTATRARGLKVAIGALAVDAEVTSRPTTREQVVEVTATPNATEGVLRAPGVARTEFTLRGGKAKVRVRLRDDTYTAVTVSVRDTTGRQGRSRLEPFVVDTSPPVVALSTDSRAAAGGRLEAAVRTETGNQVSWELRNNAGVATATGSFTARDATSTIERDVDAGTYELVVKVTDDYGRTVSKTSEVRVAVDPTPIWQIVLAGLGVAVGGIALVFLLPLLLRRIFRGVSHRGSRRREERAIVVADAARQEQMAQRAAAESEWAGRASVVSDFLRGVTDGWDVGPLPGLVLRPGETVRHMTVATAYESSDDGPGAHQAVTTREGALVVTGQRLVLLGDATREWPVEDVHDLVHVGDDESVLHHAGPDERWTMLSYGEPETTRLHLDHLRAEQRGQGEAHLAARRAELDGRAGREGAVDLSAWV